MRKLIIIVVLVLALAASMVDLGRASARPYTERDTFNNATGGSTDDHPWGGDNADDDDGTVINGTSRPRITATEGTITGNWFIDFMTNQLVKSREFRRVFYRFNRTETTETTPQATTPTSTTTTAN